MRNTEFFADQTKSREGYRAAGWNFKIYVETNLRRLSEAACKIAVIMSQFRCNFDKFLSR